MRLVRRGECLLNALLSKKLLNHLYEIRGFSDSEIANFIGVDRTSVVHARRRFDIPTRKSLGEIGEEYVKKKLERLGFRVKNLNSQDKTSLFDLLVDGRIRIEVKTSSDYNGKFTFSLTNKEECRNIESRHRVILPNGRTRKLYRLTCDFIVCVGIKGKQVYPFIIPSNEISDTKQSISITPKKGNMYTEYFKLWEQIKKPDAPTSDH